MTERRKKKTKKCSPTENVVIPVTPTLQFSPTAWAKLLFLRDYADSEVGGFGITPTDDLLFVEDVQLVQQTCSWANVAFDDESVADFFDRQVDAGRRPEQFARIWLHTHPGDCPQPSMTDENTFERVFSNSEWAVMFILACKAQAYARLRFNVGPGADLRIPISIDYSRPFNGCDADGWEQEYLSNVKPDQSDRRVPQATESVRALPFDEDDTDSWYEDWFDYVEEEDNVEGFVT